MDECQCLGDYLRQQRQDKGLSLKDIALRTKVTQAYLQALEDGHYERLPAETYLKGFLVSYADSLGLSSKKILALYHSERIEQAPDVPEFIESPVHDASTLKRSTLKSSVGILLIFFVFVGGGIWWLTSKGKSSSADVVPLHEIDVVKIETATPLPAMPPTETDVPSDPEPVAPEKTPVANAADFSPDTTSDTIGLFANTDSIQENQGPQVGPDIKLPAVMELKATGSVAVAVTIDGRDVQSYTLPAGSLLHWRIGESVDLITDPPTAAQVRFGDVVVSPDVSGRFVFSKREN